MAVTSRKLAFLVLFPALLSGGCAFTPNAKAPVSATPPVATATGIPRRDLAEQYQNNGLTFGAIEQRTLLCRSEICSESDTRALADLYARVGLFEEATAELEANLPKKDTPDLRLALSRLHFKLGDFRRAAEALIPLIPEAASLAAEDRVTLTRTLLLADETGRAAPLLAAKSDDPEQLGLQGFYELLRDRPEAAVPFFTKAIETTPNDAFTTFLLGLALERAGKRTQAIDIYLKSVNLQNPPTEAKIGLGRTLLETKQVDRAMSLLQNVNPAETRRADYWELIERAETLRRKPVDAAISRGYALYYGGKPREAEAVWKAALPKTTGKDTEELYAALHNSAYRRQEPEPALRYAQEAVRKFPRDPFFLKRNAEVLLSQNKLVEAEQSALALEKVTPNDESGEVANLLCRIAVDGGKPDLLERASRQYETVQPTSAFPFLYRAEWQAQQGSDPENLKKTLALYEAAAEREPDNAEAQSHIGLLRFELKEPEKAKEALLRALSLSPDVQEGTPHATLVKIYGKEKKPAEASFHAKRYQEIRERKQRWPVLLKALRQDRPLAEWKELGEMALRRRENWIALCAFRRATELAPKDPAVWRSLAAVYKREGYFLLALETMRKAHRLTPKANSKA
ncbi:MAG: tetratricopeptide repeat protein [Capsulimonadales bacterium]|nr:tetratricopeptide repeat protein [Capsulimonadales bacterium]